MNTPLVSASGVHLQRAMRRVVTGTGALVLAVGCSSPDTAFCGVKQIYVSNFVDDDDLPEPVIEMGDHRFAGPGSYLFKIVP